MESVKIIKQVDMYAIQVHCSLPGNWGGQDRTVLTFHCLAKTNAVCTAS